MDESFAEESCDNLLSFPVRLGLLGRGSELSTLASIEHTLLKRVSAGIRLFRFQLPVDKYTESVSLLSLLSIPFNSLKPRKDWRASGKCRCSGPANDSSQVRAALFGQREAVSSDPRAAWQGSNPTSRTPAIPSV